MKIHIIGGPGSGKTTLAKELSSRLHIPHYDLDRVNWEQENVLAIAEQSDWITEGIYLIFTEPMFYYANYIIRLEVSWPLAGWRILRRHISNSLHGTQSYPGINGLKLLFKLLRYARRYYLNRDHSNSFSVESLRNYLKTHREIADPPTEAFVKMYVETYREITVPPSEDFSRHYLETYTEKVFPLKNTADRERLLGILMEMNCTSKLEHPK